MKLNYFFLLFFFSTSILLQAKPQQDNSQKFIDLEKFAKTLHFLSTMYYDEKKVDHSNLVNNALKGIVKDLDPHTTVLPAEAFNQLSQDTKGEFGGVGMILSQKKEKLIVISAIEDTPAFKAGVKSGDEIVEINKMPLKKIRSNGIDSILKGPIGSILKIKILRNNSQILNLNLKREIIKIKSVKSTLLANNQLYIRLNSFQQTSADEFKATIQDHASKMSGIIIDLRNNPGGLLDRAAQIADLFLDSGIIVSTVGRGKDQVEREFAHKRGTYTDIPIVVIINKGSASASEILAGALQDHKRAIIVGEKSYGKGTVQTIMPLPDGAALKITIAKYLTPNNRVIQSKGVKPDFEVINSTPNSTRINTWLQYFKKHKFDQRMTKDHQIISSLYYLNNWQKHLNNKKFSKSIKLPNKFESRFL